MVLLLTEDLGLEDYVRRAMVKVEFTNLMVAKQLSIAKHILSEKKVNLILLDYTHPEVSEGQLKSWKEFMDFSLKKIFFLEHYDQATYDEIRDIKPSGIVKKGAPILNLIQALEINLWQYNMAYFLADETPMVLQPGKDSLFVKVGESYKMIRIKEILYFFSKDKMNYLQTKERKYPVSTQLKILEKELGRDFSRVHRSYVVNNNNIDYIDLKKNEISVDRHIIPVGNTYKNAFLDSIYLAR